MTKWGETDGKGCSTNGMRVELELTEQPCPVSEEGALPPPPLPVVLVVVVYSGGWFPPPPTTTTITSLWVFEDISSPTYISTLPCLVCKED